MTTPGKPIWPYKSETVLTAHNNGQWSKKHKGKVYYFGTWDDPKGALERWRQEWHYITGGEVTPRERAAAGCPLLDSLNAYLNERHKQMDRGDIEYSTYREYKDAVKVIAGVFGDGREVGTLKPVDFMGLLDNVSHLSPMKRGKFVDVTRRMFNWVEKQYGAKVEYGEFFKRPSARLIRRQRNQREEKILKPKQVFDLMKVADDTMTAIMWLGINGGFGNTDVAKLVPADVDFKKKMIDGSRHKTEALRKVPLWPETIKAIKKVYNPNSPFLFLDQYGKCFVRRGTNNISDNMQDIRDATKHKDVTFYWFRYTFGTVAAEVGDDHAKNLVMGHVIDGVPENYILRFPMKRLVKITNHVRDWLFTK